MATDPGAVDCKVADFNRDGLPDVAVLFGDARENLSLFLNRGEGKFERNEGFVYLGNQGELRFAAKTLDIPKTDRWMTIASGDIDGDGDKDLLLGGAYLSASMSIDYPELNEAMEKKGRSLLVLENQAKKPD